MARYIRFLSAPGECFNDHPLYWIVNKRTRKPIGQVFFDDQWSMWCARFKEDGVWSEECLRDVRAFIRSQ